MRPEHWLYTIPLRLRSLFRWAQADQELDDELRDHLERKTQEYVAQGMPQEEAHRRARLDLEGIEQTKEKCRDARRVNWIQDLNQDLRFGLRVLRKSPGFTAVAVLTLALGIGATVAMFSVVNSILLRPLPYLEPERLVAINEYNSDHPAPEIPEGQLSYPDYLDVANRNRSFESIAAYTFNDFIVTGAGPALHVQGEIVSYNTLHVLGVKPALGRPFLFGEDDPGHHVVILSDRFWRTHFSGDPSAIGRSIGINGRSYEIVGVMPSGFQFAVRSKPRDLWITFARWAEGDTPSTKQRGNHSIFAMGRLGTGVTMEQANSDLASIYHALAAEYPNSNLHTGIAARPELAYLVGSNRVPLLVLMGAVSLVLLIACANVANLLLGRGMSRAREIAVRSALGATHLRVIRQLVTEGILLVVAGAALGAMLSRWALDAVLKLYPANLPRTAEIGIDHRVLLFTAGLSIVTGILFGVVPAWRGSSPNLIKTMRESGHTLTAGPAHDRIRSVLVVAQTALGVVLLIGAGLDSQL